MKSLYSLIYSGVHQDFSINHLNWKTFAACSLRGKPPVMITSLYYLHYKPISLLPNFSIFLEKVMYNRLIEFAENSKYYISVSLDSEKNHSTLLGLIHLINQISSLIEINMKPLQVFSWIFPRHLTLLTIKSCLLSCNITVSVDVQLCSGLKAIFLAIATNNLFNSI